MVTKKNDVPHDPEALKCLCDDCRAQRRRRDTTTARSAPHRDDCICRPCVSARRRRVARLEGVSHGS